MREAAALQARAGRQSGEQTSSVAPGPGSARSPSVAHRPDLASIEVDVVATPRELPPQGRVPPVRARRTAHSSSAASCVCSGIRR